MNIGILGTGIVGQTIGSHLVKNGHKVVLGSRVAANSNAKRWAETYESQYGAFSTAAAFGDVVFNCTKGIYSLDALKMAGAVNLQNKILIDVANPLDFSSGMPPRLTICNDNSLGEEIQRLLPGTKIVKALNTVNNEVMVNPGKINGGGAELFICGNDEEAKATVTELLVKEFDWRRECVIDLGGIVHARSTEAMLLFFISLAMKYSSFYTGIKVLRGSASPENNQVQNELKKYPERIDAVVLPV